MDSSPALRRKAPSLVDLTIRSAIANLRYMGDVGDTDPDLLAQILTHATLAQLTHIEDSSVGRDLSDVTDPLWKRFYKNEFGEDCMNLAHRRMEKHGVFFSWSRLFKTKKEERELFQERTMEKTILLFAEEKQRKLSRQTQPTNKVPPSSRKRGFFGGNGPCNNFNFKSNLFKKAKMESLKCPEAQIHATMRKNAAAPRPNFPSQNAGRRPSFPVNASPRTSFPVQNAAARTSFPAQNAAARTSFPVQNAAARTSFPAQNAAARTGFPAQDAARRPSCPAQASRTSFSAQNARLQKSVPVENTNERKSLPGQDASQRKSLGQSVSTKTSSHLNNAKFQKKLCFQKYFQKNTYFKSFSENVRLWHFCYTRWSWSDSLISESRYQGKEYTEHLQSVPSSYAT